MPDYIGTGKQPAVNDSFNKAFFISTKTSSNEENLSEN